MLCCDLQLFYVSSVLSFAFFICFNYLKFMLLFVSSKFVMRLPFLFLHIVGLSLHVPPHRFIAYCTDAYVF